MKVLRRRLTSVHSNVQELIIQTFLDTEFFHRSLSLPLIFHFDLGIYVLCCVNDLTSSAYHYCLLFSEV